MLFVNKAFLFKVCYMFVYVCTSAPSDIAVSRNWFVVSKLKSSIEINVRFALSKNPKQIIQPLQYSPNQWLTETTFVGWLITVNVFVLAFPNPKGEFVSL